MCARACLFWFTPFWLVYNICSLLWLSDARGGQRSQSQSVSERFPNQFSLIISGEFFFLFVFWVLCSFFFFFKLSWHHTSVDTASVNCPVDGKRINFIRLKLAFSQMDRNGDDAYNPCSKFFPLLRVNSGDYCVGSTNGSLWQMTGRQILGFFLFFLCVFNNYQIDSLIVKTITSDFC